MPKQTQSLGGPSSNEDRSRAAVALLPVAVTGAVQGCLPSQQRLHSTREPAPGAGQAGGGISALHGHWEKLHAVSEPPSLSKISVGEIFPPREHA